MASKKALRAIGAGLGSIGQSLMASEERKKQAELEKRKREREDREFALRERSADLAAEKARQENMMNQIELNTRKMVDAFTVSEGDFASTIDAVNQYGNVSKKMQIDPAKTTDDSVTYNLGRWNKKADGTLEKSADGTIKFIPDTDAEGNPRQVTMTRDQFNQMFAKTVKPMNQFALMFAKEKAEIGLDIAGREAEVKSGIKVTEEEETKKTALREAQIRKLDAEAAATKTKAEKGEIPGATVEGIAGPVKLTEQEAILLRENLKGLQKEFGGVNPGMVKRYEQINGTSKIAKRIRAWATKAAKEDFEGTKAQLIQDIGLTDQLADEYLRIIGGETKKQGLLEWLKSKID